MTTPTEQSIRKACDEAGVPYVSFLSYIPGDYLYEAILALARRIEAEGVPVAWEPLHLAPRDGTQVLLWCHPQDCEPFVIQGWYESGAFDSCWYEAFHESRLQFKPKAWQPLPAPPKEPTT
jgi:hypothetical protein